MKKVYGSCPYSNKETHTYCLVIYISHIMKMSPDYIVALRGHSYFFLRLEKNILFDLGLKQSQG